MRISDAPKEVIDTLKAFLLTLGLTEHEAENESDWMTHHYPRSADHPVVAAALGNNEAKKAEVKTHLERVVPLMVALGYNQPLKQAISMYNSMTWSINNSPIYPGVALAALGMLPTDEARVKWVNSTVYANLPEDSNIMDNYRDWLTKAVMSMDMTRSVFHTRLHAAQILSRSDIYAWAVQMLSYDTAALKVFENYGGINSWAELEKFVSEHGKTLEGMDAMYVAIMIIAGHEYDVECHGDYAGRSYFATGELEEADDSWLITIVSD